MIEVSNLETDQQGATTMNHDQPVLLYMDKRYMYTEDLPDGTSKDHYRDLGPVYCGDTTQGEREYCGPCFDELKEMYPQGWHYYPGDVCPHGKYVGGCGADLMCGRCEMGE